MESPPRHRHDGTSPLPLGMDACPPPVHWTGRDTVWPHDAQSGWSYCAVVVTWTILTSSRTPSTVDPNATVFYRVQVGIQAPSAVSHARSLLRRFSDFLKLHAALKKAYPRKRIPPPPPKNPLQRINSNPVLLEERRRALDDWMQQLLMDLDFSRSVSMAGFLELEVAARGAAMALSQDNSLLSPSSSFSQEPSTGFGDATIAPLLPPRHSPPASFSPTINGQSSQNQNPSPYTTRQQMTSSSSLTRSQVVDPAVCLSDGNALRRPSVGSRSGSTAIAASADVEVRVSGPTGVGAEVRGDEMEEIVKGVAHVMPELEEVGSGPRVKTKICEVPNTTEGIMGEGGALRDGGDGGDDGESNGMKKGGGDIMSSNVGFNSGVVGGGGGRRSTEDPSETEVLGILKRGWHRRSGSGGSENSDASSASGIRSEPSEMSTSAVSTSASVLGSDLATLLAERERQAEGDQGVGFDGVSGVGGSGSRGHGRGGGGGNGMGRGGGGGGESFVMAGGEVLKGTGVILPADQRMNVQRMLTTMQRRLATAKADVDELIARLKQETAIKEFLTSKVRDLESELDDTRTKSRDRFQQALITEREKMTALQWEMEEVRVALHQEREDRRKEKDVRERAEERAQAAECARQEAMEELRSVKSELAMARREREEMEAKVKVEKRLLVKEVKSLRNAQAAWKKEVEATAMARDG